jgi:hypothetical protein
METAVGDLCESRWSAGILPAWGAISPEKRRLEASAPVVVGPFAEVSSWDSGSFRPDTNYRGFCVSRFLRCLLNCYFSIIRLHFFKPHSMWGV